MHTSLPGLLQIKTTLFMHVDHIFVCMFKISFVFLKLQGLLFIFISLLLPLAKCHPPPCFFLKGLEVVNDRLLNASSGSL